ncbi:dihydroorotate dehydrogenase (NAD+) catalytic subunit [Oscillospiraceae bacterium]|nr:dihydroorotate dehydrogenase (NAD+) catalytic subunit [Oscillospiraceae bacterium]
MADLNVNILGHDFKNPVIMSSGVFGYGREYEEFFPLEALGGMATKGTTLHKRNGSEGKRITETPSGLLFSVGLQNPGIDYYIENELPNLLTKNTNILTNVAASDKEEYLQIIDKLEQTDAPIIELNISCPNLSGEPYGVSCSSTEMITRAVRERTKKPLTVKLSPNVGNIGEIAKAAEAGGADAVSLINAISGMKIDINTRRPFLRNNHGGFSGAAIFPIALRMVWEAANAVDIPVLGIGGISSSEDALQMIMAGASCVEVGCAIFKDPYAPIKIINEIDQWCDDHGVKDINELIGAVEPW